MFYWFENIWFWFFLIKLSSVLFYFISIMVAYFKFIFQFDPYNKASCIYNSLLLSFFALLSGNYEFIYILYLYCNHNEPKGMRQI